MTTNPDRRRAPPRRTQRTERATRILDAAAQLLLRHGYRRVTIDDVAAAAGIGKGTIYLHYHTREELFGAVIGREVLHAITELRDALRERPQTSLPHRFARAYFLAIMHRPLLRGFVLADAEVWGKLASPPNSPHDRRHRLFSRRYLELLATHGLLRDDLDLDATAYAFVATLEGFLQAEAQAEAAGAAGPATAGPTTAGNAAATLEQRADLLAVTVQHAFESGRTLPDPTLQSLAADLIDLLADLTDADRSDLGIPQA